MESRSASETHSKAITPFGWWTLGIPDGLTPAFQLCVEGDGAIDPAALSAAVATASEVCHGTRLVRRGRHWVDSGQPPDVLVGESADFDRIRLDSPLLRGPLATTGKSCCEVVLVRGTPTTVVFRGHPGMMDGRGLLTWQRQVFRALRGEPVEWVDCWLTQEEVLEKVAAQMGVEMPPRSVPPDQPWRSLLGRLPSGPRRLLWRRRTIDGIHLGASAKIARLLTAYGEGGGEGIIGIPVDLRPHLKGLRTTGQATGMLQIHVGERDDWRDVDAKIITGMGELKFLSNRGDPTALLMPAPLVRDMRRWVDDMVRQHPPLVREKKFEEVLANLSQPGPVDLADLRADGFDATSCYTLSTISFSPEIDIVESGIRTEITLTWRDGPGAAERAEALLDRIEEHLSPRRNRDWDGNRTHRPAPPETLTSLFAAQVRRTPDAVAICGTEGDISYAELSQRSAAIAAELRARGIGRGDRIGLVARRTPSGIAAIWGILRAGAGYLCIDACYPDTRIAQLLADAGAPVCLMEPTDEQRDCLPAGCQGLSLDIPPLTASTPWRDADVQPDDLANIIYTSGSTGVPKGAELEHRNLVNFVRWATREYGVDGSTRAPLVASMSFDIIGFAIFLPLLAGGSVVPVPEVNAVTLREVIEDSGVNMLAVTPSHLDLINRAGIRRSTMRVAIAGGELLRRTTAMQTRETLGQQCRVFNVWGPSECAVINTCHEFDPEKDTSAAVPLGRPGDNNMIYLLDQRGRFVSPGEVGEAYIGGVQVGRGYLGRPDLTRQRYLRLADGSRVYRTGDIMRLLPGGELTFISRADDQVKVAGHRIEPAEIGQALETHPDVRQAAVIARSRPGRVDKELCAYVTGDSGLSPDDLKEFLAGRLPRYMVPAAIITVPEIPHNANGKVDARRLPDPFSGTRGSAAPAPYRDEITNAVAGIWARMLQADANLIDEQTDFRELGGNSILMLSMIEEVNRTVVQGGPDDYLAELPQIIRNPTLRTVSNVARQTRNNRRNQPTAA